MILFKSLSVLLFKVHLLPAPTLGAGLVSISALLADYLLLLFTQSYGSLQALHICGRNHKAVRFKFGHINRRALYAFFSEYFLLYFHYSRPFPSLPCYNVAKDVIIITIEMIFSQLLATASALVVSYFTQKYIAEHREREERRKRAAKKEAYRLLFKLMLYAYQRHLQNEPQCSFEYRLWNAEQDVLAEFFPAQTRAFAEVLLAVQYQPACGPLPGMPDYSLSSKAIAAILASL